MTEPEPVPDLLTRLHSDDLDERLAAIRAVAETGDEDALHILRARMAAVNKEFGALVVAVDKLKKRLGVR